LELVLHSRAKVRRRLGPSHVLRALASVDARPCFLEGHSNRWRVRKRIAFESLSEISEITGTQLWTANAGGTIYSGNGNIISGLATGDGLPVVPAGNTLSAFTLSTNP
jgi:hypothetical protein